MISDNEVHSSSPNPSNGTHNELQELKEQVRILTDKAERDARQAKYEEEAITRRMERQKVEDAKRVHLFEVWGPSALNLLASTLSFAAGKYEAQAEMAKAKAAKKAKKDSE